MLNSKVKNKQKNSGITLIALVITIIVLIILAGISVSLILGENGIIARAKTAKVLTNKAEIEEKIKLAVFAANISNMDENGEESIDIVLLEEELNKYNITDITKSEDDNLPWTVRQNGYVYEIKEDGRVEEKDGIAIETSDIVFLVGDTTTKKVTANILGESSGTITWEKTGNIELSSNTGKEITVSLGSTAVAGNEGTITAKVQINGEEKKDKINVKVLAVAETLSIDNVNILKNAELTVSDLNVTVGESNAEDIKDIKIVSSANSSVAKVENGKIVGVAGGTSVVTVVATGVMSNVEDAVTGTVNVEVTVPRELAIGDFFEYDVEYTDMYYSSYNYTKTNGWRVQSFTDNGDGTYSNIKLMSTGVPAKLYYYNDKTNTWFGNETKNSTTNLTPFQTLLNSYGYFGEGDSRNNAYTFYTGSETYYGLKAATGLYHNFETIPFRYDTAHNNKYNEGFYAKIKNGNTTYADSTNSSEGAKTNPNGGELFRTSMTKTGADTIRLLTLPELNLAVGRTDIDSTSQITDSTGLYRLEQLSSVLTEKGYNTGNYWLASTDPITEAYGNLSLLYCLGNVNGGGNIDFGVRPLVTLKSDINIEYSTTDGCWKIVE